MGQTTRCKNFPSLTRLIFVLFVVLSSSGFVVLVKGESSRAVVETVKCVCDGGCEHLRGEDCPFGLTFDMCRCCLVCARGDREPCGGALGNCAVGLHCKKKRNENGTTEEGRCSRDDQGCDGGKVVEQYGCVIGAEGNCICSSRATCPGEEMFLFRTEESCRSRMGFILAKKDLEYDAQEKVATDDCTKVHCPEISPCPIDSYRLPTIVDNHQKHSSSSSSSDEHNDLHINIQRCCPLLRKCQCIPGLHCSRPECPHGLFPKVTSNATGEPGRCCPKYECSTSLPEQHDTSVEDGESGQVFSKCNYAGRERKSGETWSHQEDCTECFCYNGVVSCKPLKCDLHPECRLARTSPQSCCPLCVGCVTSTGNVYNNSEVWEEDPCTTCTCNEGRIQCHAAMCHTTCSNPRPSNPGECCPRCPDSGLQEKEQSCPFLDCHRRECPNGFRLDKHGCPTCKCIKCRSLLGCNKKCPYGFETNEKTQCSVCECRSKETNNNNLLHPLLTEEEEEKVMMHITTKDPVQWALNSQISNRKCRQSPEGVWRVEGEEWIDDCRRCICKNSSEMCSLITCNPPNCEHPIFFPGDCCPRCPDEEIGPSSNFNVSVCQSSDGSERLEGETWSLSPCLKCTCHSGQVLCAGAECPPTPCPNSFLKNPQDCCLSCPEVSTRNNNKNENFLSQESVNSITNNSSHSNSYEKKSICLSDDSAKSYSDGETWKVGACQSCICEGGRIQCFSAGKCPPLECQRPVQLKNQCCPICLEHGRRLSSSSERERDFPLGEDELRIREDNNKKKLSESSGGIEPHCAILIASLMCVALVLGLFLVRQCFCRRSSSRLIKKTPPSFHSSNSSNNHETPPVTPDCCYKCDYNKYSSCAQLSEQKPLFKPSSDSSGSPMGHNSDKV